MTLPANYQNSRSVRTRGGIKINPAALVYESFVDPAAKDPDGISATHLGAAAAGTTNSPIDGAFASNGIAILGGTSGIPRNVVITVTHASSVVAMNGVITGLRNGKTITEAWSVTAAGTSKTFTGTKCYDAVISITEVVAADASANSIIAGNGDILGLAATNSVASAVKETSGGSVVTNGVLVAGSAVATADIRGTYAPNTIPNGSVDYEVWYLSNQPELSA